MKRMGKWLYNNYERSNSFKASEKTNADEDTNKSFDFLDDNQSLESNGGSTDPMQELWLIQQEQMIDDAENQTKGNDTVPQILMLSSPNLDPPVFERRLTSTESSIHEENEEDRQQQYHHHDHHEHVATGGPPDITMVATEEDATQNLLQEGYGKPLSKGEAAKRIPPSNKGLVWKSIIVPDNYCDEEGHIIIPELLKRNKNDFDPITKAIRPQRASLPVTLSDFRSSLTYTDDGRWIFHGVLNGWPALRVLEVVSVEHKRTTGSMATPKDLLKGEVSWVVDWKARKAPAATLSSTKEEEANIDSEEFSGDIEIFSGDLAIPGLSNNNKDNTDLNSVWQEGRVYRVKLKGPEWSAIGWSPSVPGFFYWFEWHKHRLSYGTNVIKTVDDKSQCTMVHMVSHRYAVRKESTRDRLTYHSVVVLEWDHGEYCTVVEGAYLNGLAGYKGQSNWYHDRNAAGGSRLYHSFPPEMITPWFTNAAEIRCFDVEAKNIDEFQDFIKQYDGARFVDSQTSFSHSARITYRSKQHIGQYLLNYIGRDCSYSELRRNCQTLAADLCCFLCGKKSVEPFHAVSRIEYRNRSHFFLYEPSMFMTRTEKKEHERSLRMSQGPDLPKSLERTLMG